MKKRLLLADHDDSVRKMIARVLEWAGYAVILSCSGAEAIGRLRYGQADLVLLDLGTAQPEDWEIPRQINRLNPRLPVILMTAMPNQQDRARERGVDALLEKPLDLGLLLRTIETLLARSTSSLAAG